MLAQSSSLRELHATVLHIAPIPHVVEHCGPNEGQNGQKSMGKLQKHVAFGWFYWLFWRF